MLNTLENNEFMIATKLDYLAGDPERFDVVILSLIHISYCGRIVQKTSIKF